MNGPARCAKVGRERARTKARLHLLVQTRHDTIAPPEPSTLCHPHEPPGSDNDAHSGMHRWALRFSLKETTEFVWIPQTTYILPFFLCQTLKRSKTDETATSSLHVSQNRIPPPPLSGWNHRKRGCQYNGCTCVRAPGGCVLFVVWRR